MPTCIWKQTSKLPETKNGYAQDDWFGYLAVGYELKKGDDRIWKRDLLPMTTDGSPHYGDNVKLKPSSRSGSPPVGP